MCDVPIRAPDFPGRTSRYNVPIGAPDDAGRTLWYISGPVVSPLVEGHTQRGLEASDGADCSLLNRFAGALLVDTADATPRRSSAGGVHAELLEAASGEHLLARENSYSRVSSCCAVFDVAFRGCG